MSAGFHMLKYKSVSYWNRTIMYSFTYWHRNRSDGKMWLQWQGYCLCLCLKKAQKATEGKQREFILGAKLILVLKAKLTLKFKSFSCYVPCMSVPLLFCFHLLRSSIAGRYFYLSIPMSSAQKSDPLLQYQPPSQSVANIYLVFNHAVLAGFNMNWVQDQTTLEADAPLNPTPSRTTFILMCIYKILNFDHASHILCSQRNQFMRGVFR